MRLTYGIDFAITNSGGLRADLTCPSPDIPGDFCAAVHAAAVPDHPRTGASRVLPFGNIVVTVAINGAELKTMLENGVSIDAGRQRALPAGVRPLLHATTSPLRRAVA